MNFLEKILSEQDKPGEDIEDIKRLAQTVEQFKELMLMYNGAIREVRTKLEVLNDEFQIRTKRNPIRYIKHRIKSPQSILEKMHRRGFELSMESVVENMHDIAGVRVVCGYGSDIYALADMLMKQDDVRVQMVKDYIKAPKPNGYRSLHMVIEVPVYFSDRKQYVKVEVQIRTMAMDFWASLEHQLRYKADGESTEEIANELRECAEAIHDTDVRMQRIYEKMQNVDKIDNQQTMENPMIKAIELFEKDLEKIEK